MSRICKEVASMAAGIIILGLFSFSGISVADTISDLKDKIDQRSVEIKNLEKEIEEYQNQIESVGKEANTLNNSIKSIDITRKKLAADIKLTESKIKATDLNIERLALSIGGKKVEITENSRAIMGAMREMDSIESNSLAELMLSQESVSDFWDEVENLGQFQLSITQKVGELKISKANLEENKSEVEKEKKNLVGLKSKLNDQKKIADNNRNEKNNLLTLTKNKESNYKKLLADRLAKKEALEREVAEFESLIRVEIDPNSLPKTGSGVLSWPLDSVKITQYFGNTPFASANSQVYNGSGHNGIDLRASVGTPVKSAGNGVVVDTGDTDASCDGVSYGKWVLIKHGNGLSTLYAHLSLIRAYKNEAVSTGDVIGYGGNTGYSTGPHLHFAVFASAGVRVSGPTEYKSKICRTYMKLPLSPKNGYLNPLSYL